MDVANYDGFLLFGTAFLEFAVQPHLDQRMAGPTVAIILFKPSEIIAFDEFVLLRAPVGNNWHPSSDPSDVANYHGFVSSRDFTGAEPVVIRDDPRFTKEFPNEITLLMAGNLHDGYEYGFGSMMTVPEETTVPNRWWLYTYAHTGDLQAPVKYKAASGTSGFKTQKLTNCKINANNLVEEAAQNPTVFTFETTMGIQTAVSPYDPTKRTNTASIKLSAPPGFTFICPLTAVLHGLIPFGSQSIPDPTATTCKIDDHGENILHIEFNSGGLERGTMYTFVVDLVNSKKDQFNPLYNYFTVETHQDFVEQERCTLEGFELASRLENARYKPTGRSMKEDRRVLTEENHVTFVIGTVKEMDPGAVLIVTAPQGFTFPEDCLGKVACAHETECTLALGWTTIPHISKCHHDPEAQNKIYVTVSKKWGPPGDQNIQMVVSNPRATPDINFWAFEIKDHMGKTQMAESNIRGFQIQEVLDVSITAYNRASMNIGEASPNPIEFKFMLSTRCPENAGEDKQGSWIIIDAPEGFKFPRVCRMFMTNIDYTPPPDNNDCNPDWFPENTECTYSPLPDATECTGVENQLHLNIPKMKHLKPHVYYTFRVLVENPMTPYSDPSLPQYVWSIQTRGGPVASNVAKRIDWKSDVAG